MPISAVPLDDLTWADLTTAARGRIPAASNGRWTLHAPVDPGVTLLELHAWLLEQRLYWMDQVPDALTRGALTLLGESARDATCASTVLCFEASQLARVPAGTQMNLQDSDPLLIFSTFADVTLLPVASEDANNGAQQPLFGLRVGGVDRFTDLMAGRDVCLFTAGSANEEIEISLKLTQSLPAAGSSGDITLLFVLSSGVPPQWSAAAADDVAPPLSLSWWYASGPAGERNQFEQVSDGTGGLRRSGIVRLALPSDWSALAPDDGLYAYTLWLRAETAGFTAPPQLGGLWPNAAIARHSRRLHERRDVDWLPLPNNAIDLGDEDTLPLVDGTKLRLRERDGRWHWWRPTADLSFHGREDRVFVIDRNAGTLTFGNGETGRIPVPGSCFSARDLADAGALAAAWHDRTDTDAVSAFVRALLPPAADSAIASFAPGSQVSRAVVRALLQGLNRALDVGLYDPQRFENVTLRDVTRALLAGANVGSARRRVNRLLLEDAYPQALARGQVELHLRLGGGEGGNVGAGQEWEPGPDADPTVPLAVNVVAAEDGAECELLGDARQRAAADLRRIDRAIIAGDYEMLACTTPGVAIRRAHAAVGYNPAFPCIPVPGAVTVFIVPDAPRVDPAACPIVRAPQPDPGALAAVADRLDAARLVGTELYVRAPIYRPVALTVDVEADTNAAALRADLTSSLSRFLDPLTGGDDQTGWPFGVPLTPSVLLRRAQDAIGDDGEVVRVGSRLLDSGTPEQSCSDVAIGVHALPELERLDVRVTAKHATIAGGLQ